MAVDHVIEDRMEEYFLRFIYDIMVLNGRKFFKLNPDLKPKSAKPKELVESFRRLLKVSSAKFHRKKLKRFDTISCRTRVRVIILVVLIEWIYFLTMIFVGKLHDLRDGAEGKIEMLLWTTTVTVLFSKTSLHDLRDGTIVRDICI